MNSLAPWDELRAFLLQVSQAPLLEGVEVGGERAIFAAWLREAGLLKATYEEDCGPPLFAQVHRLTWNGLEIVALIRDDALWERAKKAVCGEKGEEMAHTFALLRSWLERRVGEGIRQAEEMG